jgi:hypothetical protein
MFNKDVGGCNYFPSKSDPFHFIKKAEGDEPLSFVVIYFDNEGTIGILDAFKEVLKHSVRHSSLRPWVN